MAEKTINLDQSSFLNAVYQASGNSLEMRRQFDEICEFHSVRSGERLFKQGEGFSTVTVNLDGLFRIYHEGAAENDELTIGFIKPGGTAPFMSAIKSDGELNYSVESLVKASIMTFPRPRFLELVESDIRWYRMIWNLLYEENAHREKRERSLLVSSAYARYQEFLTEFEDTEHLIKLKYIASYLGIQPATLSRIRSSPYRGEV
jgi:CRP-like cAMP-binding protein